MNNKIKEALYIKLDAYQVSDACDIIKDISWEISPIIYINSNNSYCNDDLWVKDAMNNITVKEDEFDLTTYDTYYRYPNISLSRDKMSILSEKYSIRKVLDSSKSDFRIISNNYIQKLTEHSWRCSLSSVHSLKKMLIDYDTIITEKIKTDLNNRIEDLDDDHLVVIKYEHRWNAKYKNKKIAKFMKEVDDVDYGSLTYIHGQKTIDLYNSLYDPNIIYVTDTYMNEISGEDSVTLDDTSYKTIRSMLKSDDENVTLAMNMMANCNIMKSKTYLGLLFFHHSERLRQGKLWNQVAFKTLKEQFDKYILEHNHYHSSRYSSCIQMLAQDDALTVKAAEHLINMVFDKVINGNCGLNTKGNVFILDKLSIKLTPEYNLQIKKGNTLSEIIKNITEPVSNDDLPF